MAPPDAEAQELLQGDSEENEKENVPNEIDIDAVQTRLEELLSKQNLAEDAFIQQHMNAQMYIPLAILARHHSLCILGDEAAIISTAKAAAQRSDKFGVDEDGMMVRPLLKPRRNTLILHDLPENLPEDELKELFKASPEGESFCSLKPDVNNTAFASFKTDEAAQSAALWLRSQKLQGAEIRCSIKSEHFVRSFFPASPGPSMQASSPYMMPPHQAWGYGQPWMPVHGGWPAGSQAEQFADPAMSNMGWGVVGNWGAEGEVGPGAAYPRDAKGDGKGKTQKGKGKGRKRGALGGSFSQESQMETGSDFASPQMPNSGSGLELEAAIEGLAEPGYTHEYRKYSRQYIIEVCNAMEEISKPESYERCEKNDVALFRSSPCKDWAPLPTPMATFASSFFGDDRRGSDAQEGDEKGQGKGERASRKASWGPKGTTRSESHDYEESDWSQGDSSWWKPGTGEKRFSNSRSWNAGQTWDYKQSDGGYGQQQWVQKDEAEWEDSSGPRKMSWAEKVKGADSSDRPKWVAKTKSAEGGKEKDSGEAATAATGEVLGAAAEATSAPAEAASPELEAAPASTTPTWADKIRQSIK